MAGARTSLGETLAQLGQYEAPEQRIATAYDVLTELLEEDHGVTWLIASASWTLRERAAGFGPWPEGVGS